MAIGRKPKVEDTVITHKKCVFADAEFIKPAKAIATNLGVSKNNPIERVKLGDKYYIVVGMNAEKVATKAEEAKLRNLAKVFFIEITDVIDFLNGSHRGVLYNYAKPRVEVKFWASDGITIKVPVDATKQDIIDQLDKVERLQKLFQDKRNVTRRRQPENYKLIYAIFRARSKGLTFKEIFEHYQGKSLPHYVGSNSSYPSEDSLERYYREHKPEGST